LSSECAVGTVNDKIKKFKECSKLQPQAQSSFSMKHIPSMIPCPV
jgi:hypothetical protein